MPAAHTVCMQHSTYGACLCTFDFVAKNWWSLEMRPGHCSSRHNGKRLLVHVAVKIHRLHAGLQIERYYGAWDAVHICMHMPASHTLPALELHAMLHEQILRMCQSQRRDPAQISRNWPVARRIA